MQAIKHFIAVISAAMVAATAGAESGLPFERPVISRPSIPDREVVLTDFGAKSDGVTDNSGAFAVAMAELAAKGGGRLVVPDGIWLTGPIVFESNIEMHLSDGALILFSDNFADYPLVSTVFEGLDMMRCQSPIMAVGKTDIAITGSGTINGSGDAWRPVKRGKLAPSKWEKLVKNGAVNHKGDTWFPTERIREIAEDGIRDKGKLSDGRTDWDYAHDFLRPVLLSFISCRNVLLEDVTFENSPSWNLHPLMCENVLINRVNVRNPWYAQNGDGLDAESCRNVLVTDCTFDVGDDAICIKSGKDRDGRLRAKPCENVVIERCTVYHGHGGFVIGSEMSGGVRNVAISDCVFIGTDCGLRFKSVRGRGGVVESIYINNINMANIDGDALIFDLYYGIKGKPELKPVTEETPCFRDIHISDVLCRGADRAMLFNGLPEMPLTGIKVKNSTFRTRLGADLRYVDGLHFDNVTIDQSEGEPVLLTDVSNFNAN